LAPNGFIAAGFAAPGLAAAGFDSVAARTGDFAEPGDFNGFDAALCDVAEGVFPGFLVASWIDLLADARRVFEGDVFADVFDAARVAFPDDGLGDFLRVFLDIRLPFVAFGGSIMGTAYVNRRAGIKPPAGQV
jgi:hypothetical protein